MPITFAQPEPMAPEIQAAGGRAQIMQQNNQTLARLYETAMQGDTQASIASAHNATQAGIAHGQQVASATAAEEQNALRRQEFQAQQQPSERDQYLMAARMQEQEQHAMLQGWLQNQQMTQAEVMQKQKLENGLGGLQEALQNGTIDQGEFNTGAMMLKTHLDPLNVKAETQMAKQMQQQKQMALDAEAQGMSIEQLHAQQRAKDFEKGVIRREDGSQWYLDPKGALHPLNDVASAATGKGGKAEQPLNEEGLSAAEYAKQRHAVIRELDKKIAERDKQTAFDQNSGKPIGKPGSAGITAEERQRFLQEDLHDAGLDPSGWKPANKGAPTDTTASSFPTATPGTSGVPGGTPEPAPTAPRQPARPIPTDPDKRTEEEKGTVDAFHQAFGAVDKMPIPDDQKDSLKSGLKLQADLIQKRGSVLDMTPAERKDYLAADQKMFEVTKQGEMAKVKEAAKKAEESRAAGLRKRPWYVKPSPNDGYYPEVARQ